jgi:hypothetical protein
MASTKISDILTPDVWNEYGKAAIVTKSALAQSGIMASIPNMRLPNGGGTVNMPFFNDLTGDDEVLSDTTPLTVGNIGTGKDVAAVIGRGRAFGTNDLAAVFSGADPAGAIIDMLAGYRARQLQKELVATLTGSMFSASMAANINDISGGSGSAAVITANAMIDTFYKLGDNSDAVTAIAMHSATHAKLVKDNLIQYIQPSNGQASFATYLGKRVIVDDGLPVTAGVYTTYAFAAGAIGYVEDTIGAADIETDRDILQGDSVFAFRTRFIMHPRGIKWIGTPAKDFPSRDEMATTTNWARVYDAKAIRIVAIKHKIV